MRSSGGNLQADEPKPYSSAYSPKVRRGSKGLQFWHCAMDAARGSAELLGRRPWAPVAGAKTMTTWLLPMLASRYRPAIDRNRALARMCRERAGISRHACRAFSLKASILSLRYTSTV